MTSSFTSSASFSPAEAAAVVCAKLHTIATRPEESSKAPKRKELAIQWFDILLQEFGLTSDEISKSKGPSRHWAILLEAVIVVFELSKPGSGNVRLPLSTGQHFFKSNWYDLSELLWRAGLFSSPDTFLHHLRKKRIYFLKNGGYISFSFSGFVDHQSTSGNKSRDSHSSAKKGSSLLSSCRPLAPSPLAPLSPLQFMFHSALPAPPQQVSLPKIEELCNFSFDEPAPSHFHALPRSSFSSPGVLPSWAPRWAPNAFTAPSPDLRPLPIHPSHLNHPVPALDRYQGPLSHSSSVPPIRMGVTQPSSNIFLPHFNHSSTNRNSYSDRH